MKEFLSITLRLTNVNPCLRKDTDFNSSKVQVKCRRYQAVYERTQVHLEDHSV